MSELLKWGWGRIDPEKVPDWRRHLACASARPRARRAGSQEHARSGRPLTWRKGEHGETFSRGSNRRDHRAPLVEVLWQDGDRRQKAEAEPQACDGTQRDSENHMPADARTVRSERWDLGAYFRNDYIRGAQKFILEQRKAGFIRGLEKLQELFWEACCKEKKKREQKNLFRGIFFPTFLQFFPQIYIIHSAQNSYQI